MRVLAFGGLLAGLVLASPVFAQEMEELVADPAPPMMKPSACFTEETVVWSCQRDGKVFSVCSGEIDDALTVQFRKLDSNGAIEIFPKKEPFLANSSNVSYGSGKDEADITLSDDDDEYVFISNTDTQSAQFSYWHDGSIVDATTCSLIEQNVFSFSEAADKKTYAPVKMMPIKTAAAPDGFMDLVSTLKSLEAQGLLAAGAGTEPLDTLDGLSPKAFVLSLRDEAFTCQADHGGMCAAKDEVYHLFAFLRAFEGSDGTIEAADLKPGETPDLAALSFSFKRLPEPGYSIVYEEDDPDGAFCEARAYPEDWETHQKSVLTYQKQFNFTEGSDYEALWNGLRAVMQKHNVYEEPSLDSDVVGSLDNEMAHFPSVDVVFEADSREWREVILPDGSTGYVAVANSDLLKIDDGGKVCAKASGKSFVLTSAYYGGD